MSKDVLFKCNMLKTKNEHVRMLKKGTGGLASNSQVPVKDVYDTIISNRLGRRKRGSLDLNILASLDYD